MLFFIFLLIFPLNVFATSTIVGDVDSGRILYSNHAYDKMLIASTTKIMTCILAIENIDLDKKVVVGDEVLSMYGTNIYLEVGEEISVIDLLYGLMLRSGNDSSVVLAKNVSGSEEKFVKLMNKKAAELGMNDTSFSNPHGLDDDTKNYSTAHDMFILSTYAFKNKTYRKIISTKKYITKSSLKSYVWYNRVSILNNYKYSLGGKNGYTPSAGKVLVSYAKKDDLILCIITIDDPNIYKNHENLFEDYFKKYKNYIIIDKNDFTFAKYLIKKNVYIKKDFKYPLSDLEVDKVSTLIKIYKNSNNNIIGNVIIKLNNDNIGKLNIYNRVYKKKNI